MKGVVNTYLEDKGFGFITDENQENRFFHISEVADKIQFLKNLADYCYVDFYRESPRIVEFFPSQNHKGQSASKITMTNQKLNDKSMPLVFKSKITDLDYDVESLTRIVSGIKQGDSAPFGSTAGSNGTYRLGYPEVTRELNISFVKINDIGWGKIDVRELALILNGRKSITKKFVQNLKSNLIGKEIEVFGFDEKWNLKDSSILTI